MFNFFISTEKKLELAKNKLISDLENGSIDFVLGKMESDEIYSPLLNEMRKTFVSSDHDVSKYAYSRATMYNSHTEKEQLLEKLKLETNPIKRSNIFYCLAHLCNNTTDNKLFNFLMEKIETEDNQSKLKILLGVQDMTKSSDLNIEPLKKLAKSRMSDLYWNSIFALRFTHDSDVEGLLLSIFEETNNNGKKGVICAALNSVGTRESIPILKATYKKTRDNSLRWDIEQALEAIEEREK